MHFKIGPVLHLSFICFWIEVVALLSNNEELGGRVPHVFRGATELLSFITHDDANAIGLVAGM